MVAIPDPGSAVPQRVNENLLRQALDEGLVANRNFVAIPAPGAGQIAVHVKKMAQQQSALIRLVLDRLEATD